MQNISETTPQKIQNILVRRSCSTRIQFNSGYQHPEANYLKKYSPKYYHSLILETTHQSPLLSKVKKIKKLKKFTGIFKAPLRQELWLNLLANHKKEIEEIPQIIPLSSDKDRPTQSFWKRLIKFFYNVKRVSFSQRLSEQSSILKTMQLNYFESIKDLFVRYVTKLRKLKNMEIPIHHENYQEAKWMVEKSERMSIFLSRLEKFKISIANEDSRISELFENKRVFLQVTDLHLEGIFYPTFFEMIESCKNLRSLSFNFSSLTGQESEFLHFLASLRQLPQLRNLESVWRETIMRLWKHFKPQPCLRYLKLDLNIQKPSRMGDFEKNKPEDVVAHWEEMKELEELELDIYCRYAEDMLSIRRFITMFLKKTQKLRSLKIKISLPNLYGGTVAYQPFFIEEVAYLYESLERFEHNLEVRSSSGVSVIWLDFEMMKSFRNLRELKLVGDSSFANNIDLFASLLERNQREGAHPLLGLVLIAKQGAEAEEADWLKNILEKIERKKREDRNLKILIRMRLEGEISVEFFEEMLLQLQTVKAFKGLEVCLWMSVDRYTVLVEVITNALKKYPLQMRDFTVKFDGEHGCFEYIKSYGEKEQIFSDQ